MAALENIQTGVLYYHEEEYEAAVELLTENTKTITKMMERTAKLIETTENLKKLAEEAVEHATKDQVTSETDRKAAEERVKKIQAEQKENEEKSKGLNAALQGLQNDINKLMEQADEAASREHTERIWQIVTKPLSEIATSLLSPSKAIVTVTNGI